MAITPKKTKTPDAFILGGSEQTAASMPPKRIRKIGEKNIITVSVTPTVLERLDQWAEARGLSRAAAIALAVSQLD